MIKVAVLDDYQNIFEQIIDLDDHKDKLEFFNPSRFDVPQSL